MAFISTHRSKRVEVCKLGSREFGLFDLIFRGTASLPDVWFAGAPISRKEKAHGLSSSPPLENFRPSLSARRRQQVCGISARRSSQFSFKGLQQLDLIPKVRPNEDEWCIRQTLYGLTSLFVLLSFDIECGSALKFSVYTYSLCDIRAP